MNNYVQQNRAGNRDLVIILNFYDQFICNHLASSPLYSAIQFIFSTSSVSYNCGTFQQIIIKIKFIKRIKKSFKKNPIASMNSFAFMAVFFAFLFFIGGEIVMSFSRLFSIDHCTRPKCNAINFVKNNFIYSLDGWFCHSNWML